MAESCVPPARAGDGPDLGCWDPAALAAVRRDIAALRDAMTDDIRRQRVYLGDLTAVLYQRNAVRGELTDALLRLDAARTQLATASAVGRDVGTVLRRLDAAARRMDLFAELIITPVE